MMNQDIDIKLSFNEMLKVCSDDRQWLLELIEEGVISVDGRPEQAIFSGWATRAGDFQRFPNGPRASGLSFAA